jgi:Mn2+/Fe2+ NRAMP family transporter
MRAFVNRRGTTALAYAIATFVVVLNGFLLVQTVV